ncbi:hypothetical protein LAUMK13_04181 [Mycobacterium innocens]|uniref:Pua-like domain-containing protein n=1 Tax=Mycobacterium innocens TaxID=2341083 RepID=A0A498QBX2_9MYCO|nr:MULTISPECIES: hypothetical protein [Mycobacterium]VBA42781.1 hypothetical protein LAUMK13_04181 [Mycobacterium innocens]
MIDLVLKWSHRRQPDTIERHREVASGRGSVWWSRATYNEDAVGLGGAWLEQLRAQIAGDKRTLVFLHSSSGGTWQTQLLDITTDKSEVNGDLIPSYYDPSDHHNLWVNLTDFHEIDPALLTEGYLLARTGQPLTARGLNNQTPLILQRRDGTY